MRPLILLFILILFASCRSQKALHHMASDSTHLEINSQSVRFSASQILSFLTSSSDVDLSGITIEFFPPDSLHPPIRAMPKSLTIDKAHINETSHSEEHATSADSVKETENLLAYNSSESELQSSSDVKAFSPMTWIPPLSIVIVVTIIIILFRLKSKT